MNQVLKIDADNLICVVQPGAVNNDVKAAVAEHGLWYPPDPASAPWSTIGGNVATNAGGLCCLKYGVTRDYVLGLRAVVGGPVAHGDAVRVLGWTRPKIRDPAAADRWTWLIITCYAQLRLARPLAADLRLPWERPAPPGRLTPARVRRGFRNIRATLPCPAGVPKPGKPGPGRPPGSKNRRPAPRYDVGKTTRRERTLKARHERPG